MPKTGSLWAEVALFSYLHEYIFYVYNIIENIK